ncbi:MAG: ethanolamine permease [Neisseriaceae bacterium]|nr:ethanolamine permease [Neisseriaceae bacterium]MBP6861053.1 ethanolamine permease [Neisseriaceae bacterium]
MSEHNQPVQVRRELKKTLGGIHLWGIGVGLVISGDYFGWSYGWGSAGTLGFLITVAVIAIMYVCFIFSYTELTTAIPHAGGPFAYASRAFGPVGGYIAGAATFIEFAFAPPAIALAIGAYVNVQFPALDPKMIALCAYLVFMGVNILGMHIAATFELFVTVIAIGELLVFMGVVAPGFEWANFSANGWAGSNEFSMATWGGILAAIPFAIWFFLAIEGVAMAAEETKDPMKTVPKAYISAILTLVALALGVMFFAGGVGDWRELANLNDPLPQAMKVIVGESSGWLHMLVWLGLFGLVASFHGIILTCSRQIFALSRAGFMPPYFAKVNQRFYTPHRAILLTGVIGVLAIFSDTFIVIDGQPLTANIITMAVFGALLLYIMAMLSLFRLRRQEADLVRPFRAPFYPYFPLLALGIAIPAVVAMAWFNPIVFLIFIMAMLLGYVYFRLTAKQRAEAPVDDLLNKR